MKKLLILWTNDDNNLICFFFVLYNAKAQVFAVATILAVIHFRSLIYLFFLGSWNFEVKGKEGIKIIPVLTY